MKMCVYAYDMRPEYKEVLQRDEPIPQQDTYDIGFSPGPKAWVIFGEHLADVKLLILQRMSVHAGGYYCRLELEKVDSDNFAIVCNEHPEPPKQG